MKQKHENRKIYSNTISYFGFLIISGASFLILLSLIVNLGFGSSSPYLGMFTYLVFPAVLVGGVIIVLLGGWRERGRRKRFGITKAGIYPKLDLNDPVQRRHFSWWILGSFFLLLLGSFTGYNAFLFTESNTFCGRLCHSVMKPEFMAYQYSQHARVKCVECHVGSGVSFFVKSKLAGTRQVVHVLLDLYKRPISTPIDNLRPARETCEECHWPKQFYGAQLMQIPYFRYDQNSTSDQMSLLIKTGGGDPHLGQSAGIHWHMIQENTVYYATDDRSQQRIPWVRVKMKDAPDEVYVSTETPFSEAQAAQHGEQLVDCITCHNRPTHRFTAPDKAIDTALAGGLVKTDLPFIKKILTETLTSFSAGNGPPAAEEAKKQIEQKITDYYAKDFPTIANDRKKDIDEAAHLASSVYDRTVFPEMNVDWRTYPINIGHRNWPGCFRCHDDKHVSASGKVLTRECTQCHTLPQRGPLERLGALPPVTTISWHPLALDGKHGQLLCTKCHTVGARPPSECAQCHAIPAAAPMGTFDCSTCHIKPMERLPIIDCTTCHDQLSGLHTAVTHKKSACTQCHQQHTWKISGRQLCLSCHKTYDKHNEPNACIECHEFKEK